MARRFPETGTEPNSLDEVFKVIEEKIIAFFNIIVTRVLKRRDELIKQLNDIKQEYLNKEEMRKSQVKEFEKLIEGMEKLNIMQNPVLKMKQANIQTTKLELERLQIPNPVPDPCFLVEDRSFLFQNIESLGTIKRYSQKVKPVKIITHTKKDGFLGICVSREKIYVCGHLGKHIQIFSKNGGLLGEFCGGCQLQYCNGICVHDDWVFVSDYKRDAVFKFSKLSNYKFLCQSVGGKLGCPGGLTTDENGKVLVADYSNNRVAIFNSNLKFMNEMGKGRLKKPCDVKIRFEKIFVVDKGLTHNVHVFSNSADQLLYSMISFKSDVGSRYKWSDDIFLCFDQFGHIIISHSGNQTIQIFSLEGKMLHSIACEGNPTGVAVTDDNTIVCAMYNPPKIHFY